MVTDDAQQEINELQLLEQNLQSFLMQKQNFQSQLLEVESALEELNKSPSKSYKIIGPIMVSATKEDLEKELNSKQEVLNLRIKNLEKQEQKIKEKVAELQNSVMKKLQSEKKK